MNVGFTDEEITVLYLALEEFQEKHDNTRAAKTARAAIQKMHIAGYQVY